MTEKKASIRQIAEMANVNVSTVSRALSGSDGVSEQTREQIIKIAQSLNYKPNALARGLIVGRTQTIGIVVPVISNSFYAEVIMSIEEVLAQAGYSIILSLSHYDLSASKQCVEMLETRMVDGIILFIGNQSDTEYDAWIQELQIPLVIMDFDVNTKCADVVCSNHFHGIRIGVEHLVCLGHKRIAFITDRVTTDERAQAFRIYTAENGLDCSEYVVCSEMRYEEGGYSAAKQLLHMVAKPTALLCANDYMAIGAIKAIVDSGLRVPEDISVVGFDDSKILDYMVNSLTTIRQHKRKLGEEAGRLLLSRVQKQDENEAEFINIMIKPDLVIRNSTAPCSQ